MLKDGQAALRRDACFVKISYRGIHNRVVCKHALLEIHSHFLLPFIVYNLYLLYLFYFGDVKRKWNSILKVRLEASSRWAHKCVAVHLYNY